MSYFAPPEAAPDERQPLPANYQVRNQYLTDTLSRLRYLSLWIDDPDQALELDPFVYEKIEREIVIEKARNFRRHSVAGSRKACHVEADPSDPRSALLVPVFEALLGRIERFDTARNNLADAFFKGMTVGLLEGDWIRWRLPGDTEERLWWFPLQIRDIDKRRVRVEYDKDHKERWTIFSFERNQWEMIKAEDAWHYLWHRYDTTERSLNHGTGLCQRLVYYWTIKTVAFETFTRGAERWGYGWVVASLKNLIGGSTAPDLKTYTAAANELVSALEKQREKHIFVKDMDHVDVEVFGPQGTGHEMLRDILDYCDQQITGLILAATMPTGSGGKDSGSGWDKAEVEQDSTAALLEYDRSILAETLRGLLLAVHRCNEGNLAAMGLEGIATPRFSINEERAPDHKGNADVVAVLLNAGVPLKKSEVYEKTGFTAPDPGDEEDTIAPAAPQAAPGLPQGAPGAPYMPSAPMGGPDASEAPEDEQERDAGRSAGEFRALRRRADLEAASLRAGMAEIRAEFRALLMRAQAQQPTSFTLAVDQATFKMPDFPQQPAPIVHVAAPSVVFNAPRPPPAPIVHVAAPVVNVAPPVVNVAAPVVNLKIPPADPLPAPRIEFRPEITVKPADVVVRDADPVSRPRRRVTGTDGSGGKFSFDVEDA